MAFHLGRFNVEDFSTCSCPGKSGSNAHFIILVRIFSREHRRTEELLYSGREDVRLLVVTRSYFLRNFSAKGAYLSFQVTKTGFTGVTRDDSFYTFIVEFNVFVIDSMFIHLFRNKILFRDLYFLFLGITSKIDNFHTVAKWTRDLIEDVRRRNEHDLRKIVVQVQVVIAESAVLFRIKNFKHGRSWITFKIRAKFINLIEKDNRVYCLTLFHRLDESARHGTYVSTAMTADF